MTILFSCLHGSRLYGTNHSESDTDVKGVYLADSLDTYMKRKGSMQVLSWNNGLDGKNKVEAGLFYIQKFADLLKQTQTNAMSMVFAPKDCILVSSSAWLDLLENRDRLLCSNIASYAGYCSKQASLYTLKGEKLGTAIDFVSELKKLDQKASISDTDWLRLKTEFVNRPGFGTWTNTRNGHSVEYVRISGKSIEVNRPIHFWVASFEQMISMYGTRARKATGTYDSKAMAHAFRICREAKELLSTGRIHYPTPHRAFYMSIIEGKIDYERLQELLQQELDELAEMKERSEFPCKPDIDWIDSWSIHWQQEYWKDVEHGKIR